MGKDIEFWLNQQPQHGQCFDAEYLKLPFDFGMQNTSIPFARPCTDPAPPNCALPALRYSELPSLMSMQRKQPHGWFYCLPHLRQGLKHNTALQAKLLHNANCFGKVPNENCEVANTAVPAIRPTPKQFLVFDHTDNKTTMMFSSGVGPQMEGLSSWSPRLAHYWNTHEGELGVGSDRHHNSRPILTDELDDDHVTNEESEMYEDSEEIDALLYSDNEGNYSDDDEETSTGHSPSLLTAHEKEDWFDDDTDEVASSAGPPVKRQKLSDSGCEDPCVTDAVISVNPNRSLEYEDGAESGCASRKPVRSLPGNTRLRDEKLRETVSILQTIIPGEKGKDAIMVLDEAINYLGTLKSEARTLGLSSL
uniref:BHLH domain-containing protein n=1 Tax=Opuntia streptacantha TaxID=393608 RepID=A0A7C9AQC0_OPUST